MIKQSKISVFFYEKSHSVFGAVHFCVNQHYKELTNPAKIEGLAAGRITFTSLSNPLISNVFALSKYLLSIVIIPVIVAKIVVHTVP